MQSIDRNREPAAAADPRADTALADRWCGVARRWPAALACLLAVAAAGCSSSGTVERTSADDSGDVFEAVDSSTAFEVQVADDESRESRRERRRRERDAHAEVDVTDSEAESDPQAAGGEPVVPEEALTTYEEAVTALAAGDWFEAELQLEQFVAQYDAYPGPYVNLAIVYARDGRTDEAREALDLALGIDPGHAAANNQLGILLRETGEFEAAEAAYRRAIERDPSYALAHYNLAVLLDLYFRRGDEALAVYETYQALVAEPDAEVERWVVDLRRRVGAAQPTERVAQESPL